MKRSSVFLLAYAALLFVCPLDAPARADTPLPPPRAKEVWSANKRFCAAMDPKSMTTVVYRVAASGHRTKHWSMEGWFRVAHLADDGRHLVVGHDGGNLLPVNVKKDEPMIRFYDRGKLVRTVTLGDLFTNLSSLKRTASHLHWGSYLGFAPSDAKGRYSVKTVDGRTFAFDVADGKQVSVTQDKENPD